MLIPSAALALPAPPSDSNGLSADTPAPTARPQRDPTPEPTQRPGRARPGTSAASIAAPPLVLGAQPVEFGPGRGELTVGYHQPGVAGQLPLLLAQLSGYFEDAGFDDVTLVEVEDTLRDVRNGDLDFAVVPAGRAFKEYLDAGTMPAIAGYRNYTRRNGRYGGDVLLAQPGLVEHEPGTVIAFISAYAQALQDLAVPATSAAALELLQGSDVAVPRAVVRRWDETVAAFAPFDGGFGSFDDASGYGEPLEYLTDDRSERRAFRTFLATHLLNIAQARAGLGANPDAGLIGPPSITEIRVGMPMTLDGVDPILAAEAAGYFEAAGFESVEIMDVEQPLLGLLNGEIDFGVVDMVDAADGAAQGLPALGVAGHRNFDATGSFGGDVLLTTADLLADDVSTAAAFLIAYLQGLRDLEADEAAAGFAQFDGGFGTADEGGGTGQLQAYLVEVLGDEADASALLDTSVLEFAQAWHGLPANPNDAPAPVEPQPAEEAA